MTDIHPHGYFTDASDDGHYFDSKLALVLKDLFKGLRVLDLGCGKGDYVRFLRSFDVTAYGVDGNPTAFDPENPYITTGINLAMPRIFGFSRFDAALSLEVGEHIPPALDPIFFDNLTLNTFNLIVLSWAVPGQGGRGHVNERSNGWVIDQMELRRWTYDIIKAERLRAHASLPWFKNTLMVFRKDAT